MIGSISDTIRAVDRACWRWLVNQSAPVIRMDVPLIRPDSDAALLTLFRLRGALQALRARHTAADGILASLNIVDGKAKQFDDGLYARLIRPITAESKIGFAATSTW